VLVPVLGWLVGLVLLWRSRVWTTRDKRIGTLLALGFGALGLGALSSQVVWLASPLFMALTLPTSSTLGSGCAPGSPRDPLPADDHSLITAGAACASYEPIAAENELSTPESRLTLSSTWLTRRGHYPSASKSTALAPPCTPSAIHVKGALRREAWSRDGSVKT
jgi:hypothetical protein